MAIYYWRAKQALTGRLDTSHCLAYLYLVVYQYLGRAVALSIFVLPPVFQEGGTKNTVYISTKTHLSSFFVSETKLLADFNSKGLGACLKSFAMVVNQQPQKLLKNVKFPPVHLLTFPRITFVGPFINILIPEDSKCSNALHTIGPFINILIPEDSKCSNALLQ